MALFSLIVIICKAALPLCDSEFLKISKYFDWIWFMGIWDHSKIDEKFIEEHPGLINEVEGALDDWQIQDIIGSPYSIKNYKINSIIGDLSDFRNLRERLNKKGVKVMVDFVPDHFGIESRLPLDEPDYFINLEKKPVTPPLSRTRKRFLFQPLANITSRPLCLVFNHFI